MPKTECRRPNADDRMPTTGDLKEFRHAFFENYDTILNPRVLGFLFQKLQRFVHGLMRKPEASVVHRDHPARMEIEKRTRGIFGIGVHGAERLWIVGADRQQCDFGGKSLAGLLEAV